MNDRLNKYYIENPDAEIRHTRHRNLERIFPPVVGTVLGTAALAHPKVRVWQNSRSHLGMNAPILGFTVGLSASIPSYLAGENARRKVLLNRSNLLGGYLEPLK